MNIQGKHSNPESQIFIGDLSPSVVEADLYTLASKYGEVIYIRILRHFLTRESLGFAFVTFAQASQAAQGRSLLNGTLLKGSFIRVAKYSQNRDIEANLFLSDLPEKTTARDLEDAFKGFGPIISSKISYDKSLKSNKYGYLQFERKEHAQAAISHGRIEILGHRIGVQKFLPQNKRENHNVNNLYVRGFDEKMTEAELLRIFTGFGAVSSHAIMHVKDHKGIDRHFAYVCYRDPESAQSTIKALNDKLEHGVNWYIAPHQSKAARRAKLLSDQKKRIEDWKKRNLFIKGFPITLTENQLKEICQDYGAIDSVKILRTENINLHSSGIKQEFISRGCGFVCFTGPNSAATAIVGLKNKKIDDKPLSVFYWKPREELAKDLNALKMRKIHAQMVQYGMVYPQMMPRAAAGRGKFRGEPIPVMQMKPVEVQPKLPFDLKTFMDSTPEVQKRILGENLYPIVSENSNKKIAGKITGMLLEIEINTLLKILQNPSEVAVKVKEAIEVLRKAWSNNPEALSLLSD